MFRFLIACLIVILFSTKSFSQKEIVVKELPEICLSQTEIDLYNFINEYRAQKGLPEVKLSASLSFVARIHAKDQTDNFKDGNRCNMHSWSNKGTWSSCCYSPDHKKAKCMWDKPRELTNYKSDGFEISFFSTYDYSSPADYAKDILDGWKKSPGHNDVIINKKMWKDMKWRAIGIGIDGEYANVWFGTEEDGAREPEVCRN
jgi:uncharacterized protein YkwD